MTEVSVTKKGQITIPIEVRKKFGIQEGTCVEVKVVEGKIVIEKCTSILDLAGTGLHQGDLASIKENLDRMRDEDA